MKRFINLGHQINNDKSERPQFAFYCTEKEGFEEVNEEYTWETIEDFKQDFLLDIERIYEDVQEYIDLIPLEFRVTETSGNWSEGRHIVPKEIVREIKE